MKGRKSTRKVVPPPPDVEALIKRLNDAEDQDLVSILEPVKIWRFPRGDMHAWVPITKKFIGILGNMRDSYGLGAGSSKPAKFQLNEFTPRDKELMLAILHFIRLLMENCTNRKLFDGYEVLGDLLLTNDLDVLEALLYVFLRPLQQYLSQMPTTPELSNILRQRLLALARGWDRFHLAGIDLVAFASNPEPLVLPDDVATLHLQFYPPQDSAAAPSASPVKATHSALAAPHETPTRPSLAHAKSEQRAALTPLQSKIPQPVLDSSMVTVDLGNVAQTMPNDYLDRLAALAEEYKMDAEEQLAALNKIRLIVLSKDRDTRRKLLTCRLLVLGCYSGYNPIDRSNPPVIFSTQDAVQSNIFLYEPELITQIAELLVPAREVGDSVVASALVALDSACHHRTEVLTSINANVNHGIIMTLLRSVVTKLNNGDEVSNDIVDALLSLITYIISLPFHSNLIVGAGLIPLLLEMLQTKGERRSQYIPRITTLIDQGVYHHPPALQAFTNADGVNVLVSRIKDEVKAVIEQPPPIDPTGLVSADSLIAFTTNPLKAELRSLYRMLQSTGGADGFRNVVDTDLPKSLKRIFTNSDKFGLRNFGLAINIMSTIIHNEPTSLSILQEMQLPQTLYAELEKKMPEPFEIVYVMPNAIGAICLNAAGLKETLDHFDVIANIPRVAISWTSDDVSEREHVTSIGAALDELVRHHPALRTKVLESVTALLRETIEDGKNFKPSAKRANEYAVDLSETTSDEAMDVESVDNKETLNNNKPLTRLTNTVKLLSGLLRNAAICREFIKEGGVELVLSIAALPCIPVKFSATEAAFAIPSLLRVMGDQEHLVLTERLVKTVHQELEALPELWKDSATARATWEGLATGDTPTGQGHLFRKAAGLAMIVSFFADFLSLNFGSQRSGTALIKTLGVSSGSSFIPDLGLLHRVCLQEHVIFKDLVPDTSSESATPAQPSPTSPVVTAAVDAPGAPAQPAAVSLEVSTTTQTGESSTQTVGPAATAEADKANKTPTRAETVQTLVTRMHATLTKFFRVSVRLIFNKRVPESSHKAEAGPLALAISDIIIGHLQCSTEVPQKALAIDTAALGLATMLLFDERGVDGHLATTLFIPFDKKGGMTELLDNAKRIIAAMDAIPLTQADETRTKEQTKHYNQAVSGVRIAFSVLSSFSSPRSLVESPQTHIIEQRELSLPSRKRFSAINTFVRLRLDIFPIAQHFWNAPWLHTLPLPVLRIGVATFLELMAGKGEEMEVTLAAPQIPSEPITRQPTMRQIVANPAMVQQLVDMGFGRSAAERALIRGRNNVTAATELILMNPHLFPMDEPEPAAPAAAAPAETPATEATPAEPAVTDATPVADAEVSTPPEQIASGSTSDPRPAVEASPEDKESKEVEMEDDSAPSPSATWERQREELDSLRTKNKPEVPKRALQLLDEVEDLVFDLLTAFPSGVEGATFIIDSVDSAVKEAGNTHRDQVMAARLRLLSVFARGGTPIDLPVDESKRAFAILMSLSVETDPRPKWLPAYLLAAESILLMTYTVAEAKLGDAPTTNVVRTADFGDAPAQLLTTSLKTLTAKDLTRDEIMSCMRLVVVLTRHNAAEVGADVVRPILSNFVKPNKNLAGCQPYLAMITRHAFDSLDTLRDVMRREIREWMTPTRNKVTDVNHFARQLRQMAYRDSGSFLNAVEDECSLVDPGPVQSVYHIRSKREDKKAEETKGDSSAQAQVPASSSDPFQRSGADSFESHPVMDYLVSELGTALRTIQQEEATKKTATDSSDQKVSEAETDAYAYAGLVLSVITELVGSYFSAKKAFMSAVRHGALYGHGKGKSGIAVVLNDLVCSATLADVQDKTSGSNNAAAARRLTLSSWSTSLVVALCANVVGTTDLKDIPEDLAIVRKLVLDSVSKAFKDTYSSTPDPNVRYGRLWALGELVYRLLTSRSSVVPRQGDESSLHIAKTMLEKSFVGLMTSSLSEVDLNYPDVRNVLVSLLKALEHLTKISIKWGKTENKKREGSAEVESDDDDETTSEEASDIDMSDEEDTDGPDLYRNSALGILGGDIDIDDDGDDDDDEMDDEDELMEAFGDEIDDVMDDDEGTEPSDDEDEDDDGDMEGDWSTEDEGEEHDEDDHVIEDDVELHDMDHDAEVAWDHDDMPEDEMEEFDSEGEDVVDGFMEDEFRTGLDMEEEDELEDFDDDELGFDNIDAMDGIVGGGASGIPNGAGDNSGHWGWQEQAARPSDLSRRSRLMEVDGAASSLFGLPSRSTADYTQHPLLAGSRGQAVPGRSPHNPFGNLSSLNDLIASIEGLGGPQAVQFLESVVNQSRHAGAEAIRVDLAQRHDGGFGLSIGGRSFSVPPPSHRQLPATAEEIQSEYKPRPTLQRWLEEQNIFPYASPEQLARLVIHLINRLLPAARKAAEEDAERLRLAEAKEAELAAKKREDEQALAASVNLPESRPLTAVQLDDDEDDEDEDDDEDVDVDVDMETDEDDEEGDEDDEVVHDGPRVTVTVHGEEVDITDTGIDPEFLNALPDDMRADVIEQHRREQSRLTRPVANEPASTSQINPEFLDALPPDIRAEVIMQETMETARRNQQAAQAAQAAAAAQAVAAAQQQRINLGGPIAAGLPLPVGGGPLFDLEPELRSVLNSNDLFNIFSRGVAAANPLGPGASSGSKPKRDAIQLLERPGVASLVRLLFFPEAIRKGYLLRTLVNLCENSKTRADLLNLLLSIVQDGSGDLPAVDRSFQQMSLRGLSTPKAAQTPKGKAVETPAAAQTATAGLFSHLQSDHIPTFIAQRCFEALSFIVGANSQAVTYFLTEHEQPVGLKKLAAKKGKGKEKYLPQTKFPIVILIGLLDRPAMLKTPGMMESLTSLLAAITKPLASLQAPPATTEVEGAPKAIEGAAAPAAPAAAETAEGSATAAPATAEAASSSAVAAAAPATDKTLKAPVIPPAVLRLVVNCLTIGDCSSRTFTNTLIVLQNLSCVPDAKGIIVSELCSRSQALGVTIQDELRELGTVLANKDQELDSVTLTKFSPASSSQAQLLRLLKTIDYLYNPKAGEPKEQEKDDERQAREIFSSFDFAPMWKQLSDCLTLAEARESTDQIAAVLLPLVEALMVVCKHTRPAQAQDVVMSPMLSPTTPPPNDLFLSFTTTHRKVLNAIVRNNPSLMSGSFSLLVANPRVLEFDNKRNWFFLKLKRKREQLAYQSIHLNVRRQYVLEDSYRALVHRGGDEFKFGKINVRFINEDGVDAGGVTREWYSVLAQQIFDPDVALFEPCAADKQTYQPNKHSSQAVDNHLSWFKFVGRIIGKAIYDGRLLDAYFSRAFYKQILGRSVDMRDLESIDPEYHKSLQWMLDNDITGVIDQEFTIEDDSFGEKKIVELKEGGAKIEVTEENKEEYIRLLCAYRLENSTKDQMNAFLSGFYEVIPRQLIQIFEPDQLELLISGITTIDVDELKNSTQMSGWKGSDPEISWFWRAVRSFSQEERSRFLMFVTSSSRVPLGGFSQLQGSSGTQPFQIQRLYGKEGILPQASTCFNLLLLPKYASYEQLREKLLFAVTETSGFGKA